MLTFVSSPRLNVNPVSLKSPTLERHAMASGTEEGPHPPCRNYYPRAVVSFESGGQVVALGNISRESQGKDMKVVFAIKHRGTELPYFGFHLKLEWEPVASQSYRNFKYHPVLFKYYYDCFDCVHHTANEKEKEEFLGIMLNDATCQEVVKNDKLYVIRLFKKENHGAKVTGYGSPFVGANAKINDTYNHLSFVQASSVVTVWLFEYENLAFHVQWALDYLKMAYLNPCCKHPLSKTWTEHERSSFIATSQNSAAPSTTEKSTDSFPTQVDMKDQGPVGRGD